MNLLKRIVKLIILLSSFTLCIPIVKDIKLNEKIDNIINNKKEKELYEGFIYIPKFDYKSLIKSDESALDENLVLLPKFSDNIGENNIILAGHNNKYVFNKIYYLNEGDEIILSDFSIDYRYVVKETKYIKVDDYESLYNDNSLTLITCTNDNQERYIVIAKGE